MSVPWIGRTSRLCAETRSKRSRSAFRLALTYRVLVRLLHDTGARVREFAKIEAGHIDIEDRTVWLMEGKSEPRAAFFSPTTR
jgi:integrase